MSGPALGLQAGLRTLLLATSGVTDLVSARIYDEPPVGVTYPYLMFGNIVPQADDTDHTTGASVSVNLLAFTRDTGRVTATQIAEAVRTALHRQQVALTVANHSVIDLRVESYFADRDDSEGRGHTASVIATAVLQTA